jgi:hypothetical protein
MCAAADRASDTHARVQRVAEQTVFYVDPSKETLEVPKHRWRGFCYVVLFDGCIGSSSRALIPDREPRYQHWCQLSRRLLAQAMRTALTATNGLKSGFLCRGGQIHDPNCGNNLLDSGDIL